MASIKRRLTLTASVTLAAILGLSAIVLDSAFEASSRALLEQRLQAQLYALLGATEEDTNGKLQVMAAPDPTMATPDSPLYAQIRYAKGPVVWRSPSMLGKRIDFPVAPAIGEPYFTPAQTASGEELLGAVIAVGWQLSDGKETSLVVQIAESSARFEAHLSAFRRNLMLWFSAAVLVTVGVQLLVLNWGLRPLTHAATAVSEIQAGRRERLDGEFATELRPLTDSINRLLDANSQRLVRYRDALGNLAHTLKTPLAVIRSSSRLEPYEARTTIDEQVERMDRAVAYHLKRAAAGGNQALGPGIELHARINSIAAALRKVYMDKGLTITTDAVDLSAVFLGDDGDLMEIIGNIMDNACKWAHSCVSVHAQPQDGILLITVNDDGPGISADALDAVIQRGARADPDTPGHGIGLAVVHQLVSEVYGGELDFISQTDPAGLSVRIALPVAVGVK